MTGITVTVTNPERYAHHEQRWHAGLISGRPCVCKGDISIHSGRSESRVAARPSDEAAASPPQDGEGGAR